MSEKIKNQRKVAPDNTSVSDISSIRGGASPTPPPPKKRQRKRSNAESKKNKRRDKWASKGFCANPCWCVSPVTQACRVIAQIGIGMSVLFLLFGICCLIRYDWGAASWLDLDEQSEETRSEVKSVVDQIGVITILFATSTFILSICLLHSVRTLGKGLVNIWLWGKIISIFAVFFALGVVLFSNWETVEAAQGAVFFLLIPFLLSVPIDLYFIFVVTFFANLLVRVNLRLKMERLRIEEEAALREDQLIDDTNNNGAEASTEEEEFSFMAAAAKYAGEDPPTPKPPASHDAILESERRAEQRQGLSKKRKSKIAPIMSARDI